MLTEKNLHKGEQRGYTKEKWRFFRRFLAVFLCLAVIATSCFSVFPDPVPVSADSKEGLRDAGDSRAVLPESFKRVGISQTELDKYFHKSAFVGNSVSLMLKYYLETKPKGYLGSPKLLVWKSYAFMNETLHNEDYMLHYKGQPMKAKDAIRETGVKRAFICMGTNDMNFSGKNVYDHYLQYIHGIQNESPGIVIFIESTTPVGKVQGLLNNREIDKLNRKMEKYAGKTKDVYYIDINSPMKDRTGKISSDYCSDGFCHLNMEGCELWLKLVSSYIKNLLFSEKVAKNAVKKAERRLKEQDYQAAQEKVSALEKSTVRAGLKERLRAVKKKIKEREEKDWQAGPATAGAVTAAAVVR